MPHFEDLYESRFLKGVTLEKPITIRITSLNGEQLEGDDGVKAKVVLKYSSPQGPGELVFAKTNAILTAAILGPDYKTWPTRMITIAHDPNIMLGKERVGGIRVCGSPELAQPLKVDVKRPRRKKPETYMLYPTNKRGERVTAQQHHQEPAPPPPAPPPADDREHGGDDEGAQP